MNSEDITANDMNAISSAPASTSILSNGLEGNNNISRSNGGSHTRPMIPLLDTVGAAVTSSLASESQQFSSSSKSERQSIKQRHLTPQDVSMPDLNGYAKHTPIELKPNNVYGGNNSSAAAGQSTEVFNNIAPSRVLDGFMLLEATGMGFPNDARQATLQGRKLQAVVEEDLIFYTGLLYLDVSDNLLNFQSFSVLPKLRELRIACNNIRDIGDLNCTSFGHQSNVQMANSLANPSVSSPIPQHGGGFAKLLYLDLSYNRLTIDSVRSLYAIDTLIELDLTGNNLKNVPLDMYLFQKLERLNLSRNKLQENNSVFVSCGSIYYLRHLNLSYNFLSQVPMQAVNSPHPHLAQYGGGGGDQFRAVDHIDLSFNYIGNEVDIQPLIILPRLSSVILYGNPILGSTGEDILKIYIEDLTAACMEHRASNNMIEIDWITEIPIARNSTGGVKKKAELGRMARYKGVQVVAVNTNDEEEHRTGEEWRKQGRKTMFGEAVELARKTDGATGVTIPDITSTFMTAATESSHYMTVMTNNVMESVAESMNITSTTELLRLKDRATLPDSFLSEKRFSERMLQLDRESGQPPLNENVPVNDLLYTRSLQDPHTLLVRSPPKGKNNYDLKGKKKTLRNHNHRNSNSGSFGNSNADAAGDAGDGDDDNMGAGLSMNAAIRSLRYALAHPLTNYSEVPAKGFLPPKDYVRPTQSSISHKLPRINKQTNTGSAAGTITKRNANPTLFDTTHISLADKTHGHTGIKLKSYEEGAIEPRKTTFVSMAAKHSHDFSKIKTLTHLEEVLNSLNNNTTTMLDVKYSSACGGSVGVGAGSSNSTKGAGNSKDNDNSGQQPPITLAEEQVLMKRFARPNNQIKGLVNMINATADELDL